MSQPAVTFQIRQLEEEYKVRLFERLPGRIALTPIGEMVLETAEKILALSDDLERRLGGMHGEMRGILPVGASTSIAESLLPTLLADFSARYPQVRPRLIIANSETIEHRLLDRSLEVALVGGRVEHEDLECTLCGEDELAAFCSPDYPLANAESVTPATLSEYEFLAREPGSGSRAIAEEWFRSGGVNPETLKVVMEIGSPEALKVVVRAGVGFAIAAHRIFANDVDAGHLVTIPLQPALTRPISLVAAKNRYRSRLVSTFIDFARQRIQEASL